MPAIPPFAIPANANGQFVELLNDGVALADAAYVISSETYDFWLCLADAPPTLAASAIPVPNGTPHPILTGSGLKAYVRGIPGCVINVVQ